LTITSSANFNHWLPPRHIAKPRGPLQQWLLDQSSLTDKLVKASKGDFRVRLLRQNWQRPSLSEARLLELPWHQWVRVREVLLCGHGSSWVYARTLFPVETLKGKLGWLRMLKTRPLGAVLFNNYQTRRSNFEIARLDQRSQLPKQLFGETEWLWGRRSVFEMNKKTMLVAEIFLPALEKHLSAENNL